MVTELMNAADLDDLSGARVMRAIPGVQNGTARLSGRFVSALGPALLGGLLWLTASPAAAEAFEPCRDDGSSPVLSGTLCLSASLPLSATGPAAIGAQTVTLHVRKFPVADPAQRRGEVWLVAGGPGESGASFYPAIDTFRRAFPGHDLVVPDHRGTGFSSKLCEIEEAPDSADGIALAGGEWGPCLASISANPTRAAAFTVTNSAHDLSALIDRYREPGEVRIYAVSYGTQLVLRMLQLAKVPLDGIVLDGLVPPEASQQGDLSRRTQVVDGVGRSVLTEAQEERYRAVLDRESDRWRDVVPGGDLRGAMGSLLAFPDLRARLPQIIDGLDRGDPALLTSAIAALQSKIVELNGFPQSAPSLPLVMLISGSENNHRRGLTRQMVTDEAKTALFTSPIPSLLVNIPVPLYDRDAYFGQVPSHLPPILVVHGTLDPNTPYEGATAHAALLSRTGAPVHFTTVPNGAHFLALVDAECFIRSASAFVSRDPVPDSCDASSLRAE